MSVFDDLHKAYKKQEKDVIKYKNKENIIDPQTWIPIAEAPKDGTSILLRLVVNEKVLMCVGYWKEELEYRGRFVFKSLLDNKEYPINPYQVGEITHFQLLPDADV